MPAAILSKFGLRTLPTKAQMQQWRAEQPRCLLERILRFVGVTQGHEPSPENDPFYGIGEPNRNLVDREPGFPLRIRKIELDYFPGLQEGTAAYQIAYVTSDEYKIKAVTVTTVVIPPHPHLNRVVCQLPKTDGASPKCRTSYGMRKGTRSRFASLSESLFMVPFLRHGWIVCVPDYFSEHDAFGSGPIAGRAALDSVRALLQSTDTVGISSTTQDLRIVFWGYSAGAQASFWAANLQRAYAPELESLIVGWAGGGCPVELAGCARKINDTYAAGLIIGMITGLSNVYSDLASWIKAHLTPEGVKLFAAGKECWSSYMVSGFGKDVLAGPPDGYFNVADPLNEPTVKRILDRMTVRVVDDFPPPTQPILLVNSTGDEVVPEEQADRLAEDWIKHGCEVTRLKGELFGHVVFCFASFPFTLEWIQSRFDEPRDSVSNGKPGGKVARKSGKMATITVQDDEGLFALDGKQTRGNMAADDLNRLAETVQNLQPDAWFNHIGTDRTCNPKTSRSSKKGR